MQQAPAECLRYVVSFCHYSNSVELMSPIKQWRKQAQRGLTNLIQAYLSGTYKTRV